MKTKEKPVLESLGNAELDRAEQEFKKFEENVNEMTLDHMNKAPKEEQEPQTKLSSSEIEKSKRIYLKPTKTIGPGVNAKTGAQEKFNEKFRNSYEFDKEYVQFIAENKEIIGEDIEIWTKPYAGMNCEMWKVPTNKPVWGPRYLAEQIKRKSYHRLQMQSEVPVGYSQFGVDTGKIVVEKTVQRLDAYPVSTRKSLFMGETSF